jgi:hypothetical protein
VTTEDQAPHPESGEVSWFARSVGNDHRLAKRNSWRRHPRKMLKQRLRPTKAPEPIADPATTNAEFLARLKELPIGYWSYGWEEPEIRPLGPMAQDFWKAFGLGTTDRRISLIDGQGVLIASVQALLDRVEELERQVAALESRASTDD